MKKVIKKVFVVYFRLLKKLPATTAVSTLFIIMCFAYMNFYMLLFLLLFIPGLLFIDFVIKAPFMAYHDAKHTAKLYGYSETPLRRAIKEIFK